MYNEAAEGDERLDDPFDAPHGPMNVNERYEARDWRDVTGDT